MPLLVPNVDAHIRMDDVRKVVSAYYTAAVEDLFDYWRDNFGSILIAVLWYALFCVLLYIIVAYVGGRLWKSHGPLHSAKRVMFVTAHPDDECMFFGPVILKFAQKLDCELYLLCLSKGNYDNKGSVRKEELWRSCRILGIPDSNVTLVMSTLLPDDPQTHWREDVLGSLILNQIEALSIDTVITFDKHGVSKHANHCSLFYALALLCVEKKLPAYCRAYALETTSILRKYSCLLDTPISYLTSSHNYVVSLRECHTIKRAMQAHSSQLVWFRVLYLFFSRYLFINSLREIEILDLELEQDEEWYVKIIGLTHSGFKYCYCLIYSNNLIFRFKFHHEILVFMKSSTVYMKSFFFFCSIFLSLPPPMKQLYYYFVFHDNLFFLKKYTYVITKCQPFKLRHILAILLILH